MRRRVGLALCLAVSCGGSLTAGSHDGAAGSAGVSAAGGTSGGSAAGGAGKWGWAITEPGRTPAACDALADALVSELANPQCTLVLRLDYQTLAPLAHAFLCGSSGGLRDEAAARARASADVIYPQGSRPGGEGQLLANAGTSSEWIFYTTPTDFGGVTVVSPNTGLTVFGGSVVWAGRGDVLYPAAAAWKTSDIGVGCATAAANIASTTSFEIASDRTFPEADILHAVFISAVPAVWRARSAIIRSVTTLTYARTVANFDPATAEYVVFAEVSLFGS